jgi:hypothetical protein
VGESEGERLSNNQEAAGRATRKAPDRNRRTSPQRLIEEEEKAMTTYVEEIELNVEEMEEVIAPGLASNHNETLDVDLSVEELEEVIAPASVNHNETLDVDLDVEEMEEVIAPASLNHNETLVSDAK